MIYESVWVENASGIARGLKETIHSWVWVFWTTDFFCAWSLLYAKDPSLAALSYRVPNFQSRSELPTPSPTPTVKYIKYSLRRLVGEVFV